MNNAQKEAAKEWINRGALIPDSAQKEMLRQSLFENKHFEFVWHRDWLEIKRDGEEWTWFPIL